MFRKDLYNIAKFTGYAASVVLFSASLFCLGASIAAMIGKAEPFAGILFLPGLVLGLICFFFFKLTLRVLASQSLWLQLLLVSASSVILVWALKWVFGDS
jgi:hypothetical protein